MAKKTIAIDFDGVLHSYESGWTGPVPEDPPVEGAQFFVHQLLARGYDVVVYSTRCGTPEGWHATKDWLEEHEFPSDLRLAGSSKPPAIVYVDDRAFRFEGNFGQALGFIDSVGAVPWNKRAD